MKTYNYIYLITNKINGKIYIGKHSTDNLDDGYMGSGNLILKAELKYGIENFAKEYLAFCDTEETLNYLERFYIKKYKAKDKEIGYNLADGGNGGALFIGKHHSEKTKLKMSNSLKGREVWNEGKIGVFSEESILKNRQAHLGKKLSIEHKRKISESLEGKCDGEFNGFYSKHHNNETKRKISEKISGENNGMYGKIHTKETKIKMSEAKKGKHRVWNEDHTKYHFE